MACIGVARNTVEIRPMRQTVQPFNDAEKRRVTDVSPFKGGTPPKLIAVGPVNYCLLQIGKDEVEDHLIDRDVVKFGQRRLGVVDDALMVS